MDRELGTTGRPVASPEDDALLLSRVQRGDEAAMAVLYDRYSRIVYSVSLRVLRDAAAAEDVLQEIFMQIWRTLTALSQREEVSLGGWPWWRATGRSTRCAANGLPSR